MGTAKGKSPQESVFFDHMLNHIAKHGLLNLTVNATGDLHIDDHHTVEDVGIALGKALAEALGDRAGIARVGNCAVPMDEALVFCAIDISGRGFLACDLTLTAPKLGDYTTELTVEFFPRRRNECRMDGSPAANGGRKHTSSY